MEEKKIFNEMLKAMELEKDPNGAKIRRQIKKQFKLGETTKPINKIDFSGFFRIHGYKAFGVALIFMVYNKPSLFENFFNYFNLYSTKIEKTETRNIKFPKEVLYYFKNNIFFL